MAVQTRAPKIIRQAPRRGLRNIDGRDQTSAEYTTDCLDVYYKDGYVQQRKGYAKVNTSAMSSTVVERIHGFDSEIHGSHMLVQVDGDIYKRAGNTFTRVLRSDIAGQRYGFVNGLNTCLITRAYDQSVLSWDGVTFSGIGGAPRGLYPFFYRDHFWVGNLIGAGGNKSVLQSSGRRNINSWASGDTWHIDSFDGQEVTGIGQSGRYLAAVKPDSITYIYGSFFLQTSSSFDGQTVAVRRGIGGLSHNALINANGLFYTVDKNGIWAIQGAGEASKQITAEIPGFWERVNTNVAGEFCSAHFPQEGWLLFALALDGAALPNYILIYDYKREALWPLKISTKSMNSITVGSNKSELYFGDQSGFVYQLMVGDDDSGTAIASYIEWPAFGHESLGYDKLWKELKIFGKARGTHTTQIQSWADGKLGNRMQTSSYTNAVKATNQETDFRKFVSIAHTGELLSVKLTSNAAAGTSWAINRIEASADRVTE